MRYAMVMLALLVSGVRPSLAQVDTVTTPQPHQITVGASVRGRLTHNDGLTSDHTYAQDWVLTGTAGRLVTVDLASRDFDAFLMVGGAGLDATGGVLQDDDSGGHCNARLTFRIPASGRCDLVVTTNQRNAVGTFTLAVRAGAIPASLAPCHG